MHRYDLAGRKYEEVLVNTLANFPATRDRTTTMYLDAAGNPERTTTSDGTRTEETRMAYDGLNRVIELTVENGASDLTTVSKRDQAGHVIESTDPRGYKGPGLPVDPAFTVKNSYDELGRPYQTVYPSVANESFGVTATTANPTTMTGFDTFGSVTHAKDAGGFVTETSFDQVGRRVKLTHPSYTPPGGTAIKPTETYGYDAVGNTTSTVDRRGFRSDFTFDSFNRAVKVELPAPASGAARPVNLTWFDDVGRAVKVQSASGAVSEMTYDALGRTRTAVQRVRRSNAADLMLTTSFNYDAAGNRIWTKTPDGEVTTAVFSPAGQLLRSTDQLGNSTNYEYDVAGRLTRSTDVAGRSARTIYDLSGRATRVSTYDAAGVEVIWTAFGYDANGNQTTSTQAGDSAGSTITNIYAFDAMNRLTSVVEPTANNLSMTTTYGYEIRGLQTRTTDGRGAMWWTTYNPWGLVESRVEPSTTAYPNAADRTFTSRYDAGGLEVSETQPGGSVVAHTYDNIGRLVKEVGGSAATTRLREYDGGGRLSKVTSGTVTVALGYDDRDLLTSAVTSTVGGNSSFEYDEMGRMTKRVDPAGTTQYGYTARGEMNAMTDPVTGQARMYSWKASGELETETYGPTTRTYGWDSAGRLQSDTIALAGVTKWSATYGYDARGNVKSKVVGPAGVAGAGANAYVYDFANRLVSWSGPGSANPTAYTYDGAGNRTKAGTTVFTYDERNRALTEGIKSYKWTAKGTMKSMTSGATTTTYTFDGLGRMTAAGSVTYAYDGFDRIVSRNGTAFTYSGLVNQPTSDGSTFIARSPSGDPVAAGAGATRLHLGADRHGDVTVTFTTAGTVVDTLGYDPFGQRIARTGTTAIPIGFQGSYTDPTTGLIGMGARWYSASTGAFLSRDIMNGTLRTPVSLNRYTYANNNPLAYFDPDGREPRSWVGPSARYTQRNDSRPDPVGGSRLGSKPRPTTTNYTDLENRRVNGAMSRPAMSMDAETRRETNRYITGAAIDKRISEELQYRKSNYATWTSTADTKDPESRQALALAIVNDYFATFDVAKTRNPSDANGDMTTRDFERVLNDASYPSELRWAAQEVLDQDMGEMWHTKKTGFEKAKAHAGTVVTIVAGIACGIAFAPTGPGAIVAAAGCAAAAGSLGRATQAIMNGGGLTTVLKEAFNPKAVATDMAMGVAGYGLAAGAGKMVTAVKGMRAGASVADDVTRAAEGAADDLAKATNTFPSSADDLTKQLGVDPVQTVTKDGTQRFRWEPNERTRITMESHPEGLKPGDVGFNPRHHGEHFHVQTRPTATTGWNNPAVTKVQPPGYTPGSGTGFLPGEAFP